MKKIYLLLLLLLSFTSMKAQQNCTITNSYDASTFRYTFAMTPNGINTSVLWNFGDSTTGVGLPVSHQFSTSGIYVICATEIDITTQNVISYCCYSLNAIGTTTTCTFAALSSNGTDFTFNSNASSAATVTWDFGDGTIGTGLATAHTYVISGVYNICMTTSDFLGTCTTCQTITVNVGPSPCSISMAYDSTNMNTVFFDYTPIGGAGNTITWTFGDGVTASGGTSQQHTYASAGVYTAIAIEYDSTGTMVCQAGIGVQVGPATNCTFTVIPSMGALNTFFFNTSYDTTLYVAVWDFGDGISYTGGQSETHTYAGPGTYFACMNIIDQATQNIACTYCQPIIIPGPTPCAANFTTVPFGLDAYFIDYSSADPSVTTYTWDFGDGTPYNTSRFPVHTYSIPGTYNVCLQILNSTCADTVCQQIVVDSTIIAPVFCTSYFIFTQLSPYQLAVVNLSSGTNLSFAWDFGDGSTSTAAYPIHNYTTTGSFIICLTVADGSGCTNTYCDSLTVDSTGMITYRSTNVGFTINVVSPTQLSTVSIDENISSLISNVYPNPSKDRIVVTSPSKSDATHYSILSISSQLMSTGKISGEKTEINISDLSPGIYFLEVRNGDGEKTFARFIKN